MMQFVIPGMQNCMGKESANVKFAEQKIPPRRDFLLLRFAKKLCIVRQQIVYKGNLICSKKKKSKIYTIPLTA